MKGRRPTFSETGPFLIRTAAQLSLLGRLSSSPKDASAQILTNSFSKGAKNTEWRCDHGSKKCVGTLGLKSSDALSGEVMKRRKLGPLDLCVHRAHRQSHRKKGETRENTPPSKTPPEFRSSFPVATTKGRGIPFTALENLIPPVDLSPRKCISSKGSSSPRICTFPTRHPKSAKTHGLTWCLAVENW